MDKLTDEIKTALQNNDQVLAVGKIQEYLKEEKNIPLNIAITGESGSGKSTFVNAFRGIDNRDKGAAPTGCVETTTDVKPYPHPNYPNVTLWDLPGIGTTRFPADKYLQHFGFEKFDFFIIISDTRFRENDAKLAKEIQKMRKKFYFVRSKIDDNLRAAERSQRDFVAEKTLKQIRESCIQGLQKEGFKAPQVFLVSNFELQLHDFPLLHETLERELPEHKKDALLFAMPNISLEIINRKKEAFKAKIEHYALVSAGTAAVPVPGLSIAVDLSMIAAVVTQYVTGFGLDPPSLRRLSVSAGVSGKELMAVIMSPLSTDNITPALITTVLFQSAAMIALVAAEEGLAFIPIFGSLAAAGVSFFATKKALSTALNMVAEDAQRVFERALGLNASV